MKDNEGDILVMSTPDSQSNSHGWIFVIIPIVGSIIGILYNNYAITLYLADKVHWSILLSKTAHLTDILSYIIPIINSIPDKLIAHNQLERAILVRNLYAIDWFIILVAALLVIPERLYATQKGRRKFVRTPPRLHAARFDTETSINKSIALTGIATVIALSETWIGTISYDSISGVSNHVQWRDSDLYRLCIFLPILVWFGILFIQVIYIKIYYRAHRNRANLLETGKGLSDLNGL